MSFIRSTVSNALQRAYAVKTRVRVAAAVTGTALFAGFLMPAIAAATETEAEKTAGEKITAASTSVGTSGQTYILDVLTALVSLIALVIILPKAVGFIRRFI